MTSPWPAGLPERFRAKLIAAPSGCWIWTGGLDRDGYGRFRLSQPRGMTAAHRFSYQVLVGPVGDGLTIDHLCRVRACVNPCHLEPVSKRENTLRGTNFTAGHARQTHCKWGHEFTESNTYLWRGVHRHCRACRTARDRSRVERAAR